MNTIEPPTSEKPAVAVVYRLSDEEGQTRFEYTNEFALPGGMLGKAAGGLLAAALVV